MSDKPSYGGLVEAARALAERAADLQLELDAEDAARGTTEQPFNPGSEEEDAKNRYKLENQEAVDKEFSDLPDLFTPLSHMPEPSGFENAANGYNDALQKLAGPSGHKDFTDKAGNYGPYEAYEQMTNDALALDHWTGVAADAYRLNFLAPLERVVWNQFNMVATLRGSLLAERDLWEKGRDDACQMIADANAAIDALYEKGDSVTKALGILGAIVGVVAVPFTGGSSAALAWAAAGATIAVAGTVSGEPDKKEPAKLSGSDPRGVIKSLRTRVADFKTQLTNSEQFITDKLSSAASICQGRSAQPDPHDRYRDIPGQKEEFELPRPALADSTEANVTDKDHVGVAT